MPQVANTKKGPSLAEQLKAELAELTHVSHETMQRLRGAFHQLAFTPGQEHLRTALAVSDDQARKGQIIMTVRHRPDQT